MLWRRGRPLNAPPLSSIRVSQSSQMGFATQIVRPRPGILRIAFWSGDIAMRMPILTYFLVVGVILFGGMRLVSSQLEAKPLPVSQKIGVPAPFKAPPDATR